MAQHMAFPVAAWLPEDLCPAAGQGPVEAPWLHWPSV